MSTPAEKVKEALDRREIPDLDSIKGLEYSDLRPGFNLLLNNFDIIATCSRIMSEEPGQVEQGKQFLKALFEQVVEPAYGQDSQYETEGTLSYWAATTGQVDFFTERPTDIYLEDKKGQTPFARALQNKHFNVVTKLIELGYQPNPRELDLAIRLASAQGNQRLVTQIIGLAGDQKKVILNPVNVLQSPLLYAYDNGQLDVATRLIAQGANPFQIPNNGAAFFMELLSNSKTEALLHLMQNPLAESENFKAFLANTMPNSSDTPLMAVSRNGNREVAAAMLNLGLNPMTTNGYGSRAISIARTNHKNEIVDLFKPYETRKEECTLALQVVKTDYPKTPRGKVKAEAVRNMLIKLEAMNDGTITAAELRQKPIPLNDLVQGGTERRMLIDHLSAIRGEAVDPLNPGVSLEEVLEFHTNPRLDKMRGAESTKSAQEVLIQTDPDTLKREAITFLEDVIDRLEKEQKRDIAPRSAKKDQRTQIRGEKITALEKLAAALEGDRGNSVHTVKDLCHFRAKQGDDTLLTVLKRHQDPAKRDTKDTKSYQEFYKKFRLDLHGYDPLKPKGAATIKNPLAAMKEARAAKKTIAGMREEKRQSQEPYIDIDTRKNKMNTQSPL